MHDFDESDDEEETNKFVKKWVRNGSVVKHIEVEYDFITGYAVNHRILWKIDLMIFIHIPFILLLIALFIWFQYERYQACMEIFDKFWYCSTR